MNYSEGDEEEEEEENVHEFFRVMANYFCINLSSDYLIVHQNNK